MDKTEYKKVFENARFTPTPEEITVLKEAKQQYDELSNLWKQGGRREDGSGVMTLNDVVSINNSQIFLPRIMTQVIRESAEPMLIGTQFLERINSPGWGFTVEFPSVAGGSSAAGPIAETGEYPRLNMTFGGSMFRARINRYGVAADFTEQVLRYSNVDIYNMYLREMGRDMARFKEKLIFNFMLRLGTTIFDNTTATATASIKGKTTGRNIKGKGNGTLTMEDLFDMYTHLLDQGFVPDSMLMHPATWLMWVKDPVLRTLALNGNGGVIFANWAGKANVKDPWTWPGSKSSGRNVNPNTSEWELPYEGMQAKPQMPGYFPFPLRIYVSPLVPYSRTTGLTNFFLFDSNNVGYMIVDQDLETNKWDDPEHDIQSVKVSEAYALGLKSEGQAVAVAKGIKVNDYNQVFIQPRTILDVADVEEIDRNTDVLD